MKSELLTRYVLKQDDTRMNVLLDRRLPRGTTLTLVGEDGEWVVVDRHETLERRSIKRGWDNNI